MSNIVSIGLPKRPNLAQRQAALMKSFSGHRRHKDDVFWLKENAELLNILASSGAKVRPEALEVYREFYDELEERLTFFPQYYRFLLSICLDLEDLGLAGNTGEALCRRVHDLDLAACELSDLQRAEAQHLLARRSGGGLSRALKGRLMRFMEQTDTFSRPNKKAAYELTHIVFYLSNYGAQALELPTDALTSLEFAGLLAFLDRDVDLLAEVCTAQRFAGQTPSAIWEDWLALETGGFILSSAPDGPSQDAYHEYLVTSWWAGTAGMAGFLGTPTAPGLRIDRARTSTGPLRSISELMYRLRSARSADWARMRPVLHRSLAEEHHHILRDAEQSSPRFEVFFEGFARAQ
ncbi:MAG: hypothetical protein AAF999_04070 [Pseudomonadota bacterium]